MLDYLCERQSLAAQRRLLQASRKLPQSIKSQSRSLIKPSKPREMHQCNLAESNLFSTDGSALFYNHFAMNFHALHQQMTAKRLATMLLSFWIAGVGCLLGYCADVASASVLQNDAQTASTPGVAASCAMRHGQHDSPALATTKRDGVGASVAVTTDSDQFAVADSQPVEQMSTASCCPMAGQTTTAPRTLRLQTPDHAVLTSEYDFAPQLTTGVFTERFASRRAIDRGGAYLRHCVFLI